MRDSFKGFGNTDWSTDEQSDNLSQMSTVKLRSAENSTLYTTMVNLFNTITGPTMLGLPYALANSGVLMGSLWFIITGVGEAYAIHLLAKCAIKERVYSFKELAQVSLKFKGSSHLVNAMVAINGLGLCCAHIIIVKQVLPDIVRYFFYPPMGSILLDPTFWVSIVV